MISGMAPPRTFVRYTLLQIPGWLVAGLVLYGAHRWFGLAGWIALVLFTAYVAKDFVPLELIGHRGLAVEEIAPKGYVRVRGELWMAEVARGAAAVPAGSPVRVQAVRGNTLQVMVAPDSEPR
jgi:membrane protein implicated in regulation of membrane protease activity